MVLILLPVFAAVVFAYYTRRTVVGFGLLGAVAGAAIFSVAVAGAQPPKVPCWTESKHMEIFRAMPFICQSATRT